MIAALPSYVLVTPARNEEALIEGTIASGILILAGSVIGAYVFGATWDDRNVMAMMRRGGRRRTSDDETPLGDDGE